MTETEEKRRRIREVRVLLEAFAKEHLTQDLSQYVFKLWEQIGRKKNYVITGGKTEIWASAVVYVIARLNFLFDRSSPNHLSPDAICNFFGTKKATVGARAKEIEKSCRIRIGHEGLCSPDISDSLTCVQLSNGMVVTKKMAKEMGIL